MECLSIPRSEAVLIWELLRFPKVMVWFNDLHVLSMIGWSAERLQIYNLGNTRPHTVTDMVLLLERHLGREAIKRYVPVPPTGDVLATSADISDAQAVRHVIASWFLLDVL